MKLPRLQVRLGTILLLLAAISFPAARMGKEWREKVRRQREDKERSAVTVYLIERGAKVSSWYAAAGEVDGVEFRESDMQQRIAAGTARGPAKLTLEDFERLRLLGNLKSLSIEGELLTTETVGELATLDRLTHLEISHSSLNDEQLQMLSPLENLQQLFLEATQVTDSGVESLRLALPKLEVADD